MFLNTAVSIIDAIKNIIMLTAKKIGIDFNPDLMFPFLIVEIIMAAKTALIPRLIKTNVLKSLGEIASPPEKLNGKLFPRPAMLSTLMLASISLIKIMILWDNAYKNGAIIIAANVIKIT